MRKRYTIILIFLTIGWLASSAGKPFELSFWGQPGMTSIYSRVHGGENSVGFGGHIGIGFNGNLNNRWQISSGLEISFYNSSIRFPSIKSSYETYSDAIPTGSEQETNEMNKFIYMAEYENMKEYREALYLQIPVLFRYFIGKEKRYFAGIGAKLGVPLFGHYRTTASSRTTKGYFPHEDCTYTDLPRHGFSTVNDISVKNHFSLQVNAVLTAEAGFKCNITKKQSLYLSAYIDYGFTHLYKGKKENPLLEYRVEDVSHPIQHSLSGAQYHLDNGIIQTSGNTQTLSAGIKIQWNIPLK